MKPNDILRTCVGNLLRRKARTMLTVLGVVIGCCSIVIMISIGAGMKESQEKMLSSMGDLTIITVSAPQGGKGKAKLDDKIVGEIKALPHVLGASPKLTTDDVTIKLYAGMNDRYVCDWATVAAIDRKEFSRLGYTIKTGSAPVNPGEVAGGENFAYNFRDSLRPDGSNMIDLYGSMYDMATGEKTDNPLPDPFFDPLKTTLTIEITPSGGGKPYRKTVTVSGILKADQNKGYETSDGVIFDLAELEKLLADAGAGKSPQKRTYQTVLVKTDGISSVADTEDEIKKLGFQTYSMESVRKPMEEEARQKQLMLGGLGAISLIVAAIGITNTMIMSISERTREIGIMKSLGCYVGNVRAIFLTEAGMIGVAGGVIGCVVSFIVSAVMNVISAKLTEFTPESIWNALITPGSRMSVIEPWLYGFALAFSLLIGLASGYYPSNKAVKVPALEAIKYE